MGGQILKFWALALPPDETTPPMGPPPPYAPPGYLGLHRIEQGLVIPDQMCACFSYAVAPRGKTVLIDLYFKGDKSDPWDGHSSDDAATSVGTPTTARGQRGRRGRVRFSTPLSPRSEAV